MNTKQKSILISQFPELSAWLNSSASDSQSAANSMAQVLLNKIEQVKGEKGDKGDMPVKGKDYWTDEELKRVIDFILSEATPVKGEDYVDGEDYVLTEQDKKEIAGKIKVPIVEKIIERTEVIKEVSKKESLDISDVKNGVSKKDLELRDKRLLDGMARVDGRVKAIDQRWHGGLGFVTTDSTLTGRGTPGSPLSVVSVSGSIITVTGTRDDSNVTFGAASRPSEVVINGSSYISTGGAITWTWLAGVLTLSVPVGINGSIYART